MGRTSTTGKASGSTLVGEPLLKSGAGRRGVGLATGVVRVRLFGLQRGVPFAIVSSRSQVDWKVPRLTGVRGHPYEPELRQMGQGTVTVANRRRVIVSPPTGGREVAL
jgi:hypothetical protein